MKIKLRKLYVVRGYHKISNVSYIVGIYSSEEKARIAVDNSHDADINGFYNFNYGVFWLS